MIASAAVSRTAGFGHALLRVLREDVAAWAIARPFPHHSRVADRSIHPPDPHGIDRITVLLPRSAIPPSLQRRMGPETRAGVHELETITPPTSMRTIGQGSPPIATHSSAGAEARRRKDRAHFRRNNYDLGSVSSSVLVHTRSLEDPRLLSSPVASSGIGLEAVRMLVAVVTAWFPPHGYYSANSLNGSGDLNWWMRYRHSGTAQR